jgi:hypothetical protein
MHWCGGATKPLHDLAAAQQVKHPIGFVGAPRPDDHALEFTAFGSGTRGGGRRQTREALAD